MKNKKTLYSFIAVILFISVWQIAALAVNREVLLASPISVAKRLFELLPSEDFINTVLSSFLRITAGFLLSFVIGIVLAAAAFRFRLVRYILQPFVATVKAVPVVCFIIWLLLLMSDNSLITVIISFLIAFPVMYSNVLHGIQNADKELCEVAKVYKVSNLRKIVYVYIPSIKPFLMSAVRICVGMSWKSGIAAEVIVIVNNSIGSKLLDAKTYLANTDLLAWTLVIVFVSVLSEKVFLLMLKAFFKGVEKI